MDNINVLNYITDSDPTPLVPRDPAEWYVTTYIQVETTTDDQLMWLLAQGWIVYRIIVHNLLGIGGETYYTWFMMRRVISGEKTLIALVEDYTDAYNEGRELNDQRYDDIVALHAALTDETQDELITLVTNNTTYDALIEALITSISADWTAHDTEISGDLDAYGTAQVARINTQYDSELSKAQAHLVNTGMYNTLTWTSASAGIERERAVALNEFNDKLIIQQVGLEERLYAAKTQMRDRILAARDRLFRGDHTAAIIREELRTRVITALCNFMERRTDSYPDLTAIGNAAAELGAGVSVTGGAP
jgi:hypothetical protein